MSVALHPTSARPWPQLHELWAGSDAASAGLSGNKRKLIQNDDKIKIKINRECFSTEVFVLSQSVCCTYVSLCVQCVVGELGVVKRDGAALPVSTRGR